MGSTETIGGRNRGDTLSSMTVVGGIQEGRGGTQTRPPRPQQPRFGGRETSADRAQE